MKWMRFFLHLVMVIVCFVAVTVLWVREAGVVAAQAVANQQSADVTRGVFGRVPCVDGYATISITLAYPCDNVDLLAQLPLSEIGGDLGNDIWGWTDPETDKEYAIMGRRNGTAFVEITHPENPVYLGNLPTHVPNTSNIWRDIKVYQNHAYIVSEQVGHGMQIFDLRQLRTVISPSVTFTETAHFNGFSRAHNLVINEASGYGYAVGGESCNGGLYIMDLSSLITPTFASCFSADGYTHDAQCVNYHGPDTDYTDQEICVASNTDTITIVNVTDHANPIQLARLSYSGVEYTHQGWFDEAHHYFYVNDELDEYYNGHNTRTYVWDLTDLDAPVLLTNFTSTSPAIDHNLYTKNGFVYQANYRSGLRILDVHDINQISQAGYFDIYPADDNPNYNGAWSVYPYFPSGVIVVSGIEQGLFVLDPLAQYVPTAVQFSAEPHLLLPIPLAWLAALLLTITTACLMGLRQKRRF